MQILIVLGTRPEAVKLAPVICALRETEGITPRVVFTAQHRQIAGSILEYFRIVPDYDLDIMTPGQSLSDSAARMLSSLDSILQRESPDWVIVQGDTTSAMAAALAAFYRKIPVAHVEAGLRSGVMDDPFPEEMNRRLISHLASLHFAATAENRENLLREDLPPGTIHVTGNPVIDALQTIMEDDREELLPEVAREIMARGNRMVLLTTHRRENFGEAQGEIFRAIGSIIEEHSSIEVMVPIHPNPAVAEAADAHLPEHSRIHRIEPLDYPRFIHLLSHCWLALTDSGGIQEEAPALGVPTLVLRTTTEREEGIRSGSARLVGVKHDAIVSAVRELVSDGEMYAKMSERRYPFGEGGAAGRIVEVFLNL